MQEVDKGILPRNSKGGFRCTVSLSLYPNKLHCRCLISKTFWEGEIRQRRYRRGGRESYERMGREEDESMEGLECPLRVKLVSASAYALLRCTVSLAAWGYKIS
jgi:hypothetical protein